jgi:predicted metalloprotease with PDZ domain
MSNEAVRSFRMAVVAGLALVLSAAATLRFPADVEGAQALESPAFRRIAYRLAMPRPASHLFHVTIDVETPPGTVPPSVDFQIPRWQPGRYSVADFAANVQEFSAHSGNAALEFEKTDDQTWRVFTGGSRRLTVEYKMFGNDLSGTYAQLDVTHASFTGGELFMYPVGHKQDAVELQMEVPEGWRVINGSSETPGQSVWRYPNYELLIDNPTEVGPDWTLDTFDVDGKNYRVVVHSRASEGGHRPELVRDIEKVVRAAVAMWGPPDFDRYTFLIHYAADGVSWDGMEHLNSTQIVEPGSGIGRSRNPQASACTRHGAL